MIVLKRILVPTNFGAPSRNAINYGIALARQFNAQLFLLHVLDAREFDKAVETERVLEVLADDATKPRPEPTPEEVARNVARQELGGLLDPHDAAATRAEYLLRPSAPNAPGDAIVACAAEFDVELIVIGKHPQGFIDHLMAGSVTERVIRHAPCPVLIVQYREHEFVVPDPVS